MNENNEDKIVQIGKYKVQVVKDLCIGAASCIAIAPNTFELDDERKAVILEKDEKDAEEMILMGAQSCPTKAVLIWDAETGEQIWPA